MAVSANRLELLQIADAVAREKSIDRTIVITAMEDAIAKAARSRYGAETDVHASIDAKTGEFRLSRHMLVVETVENSSNQISLDDAKKRNPAAQVGDTIADTLPPLEYGRIAAQSAKQVIVQKVREAERDRQFIEYKDRIGDIINGIVKRVEYGNVVVDLGRGEAIVRRDEMLPRETLRNGDRVRAFIYDVRREPRGPQIFLSRTHPQFMAKLFAQEVPEIYDGIVEVKAVARDPGSRAKIAVISRDSSVDPVGACVGMRGSRVQAVVNELQGEKIDIIPWSQDIATFVVNALAPAEVAKVVLDEDRERIEVVVPDAQLSLAIGRRGQNVRLASQLTGWDIDILTEQEESERRQTEFQNRTKVFMEALDVDEVVGQLLASEGFGSVEELAVVDEKELAGIEGFDEDTAGELQTRAKEYLGKIEGELDAKRKELGVEDAVKEVPSMTTSMLVKLGEAASRRSKISPAAPPTTWSAGPNARTARASASPVFSTAIEISREEAEAMIMQARVKAGWITEADLARRGRGPAEPKRPRVRNDHRTDAGTHAPTMNSTPDRTRAVPAPSGVRRDPSGEAGRRTDPFRRRAGRRGGRPQAQAAGPRTLGHRRPGDARRMRWRARSSPAASSARSVSRRNWWNRPSPAGPVGARCSRHRGQGGAGRRRVSPRSRRRWPATRSWRCCTARMRAPTGSPSWPARSGTGTTPTGSRSSRLSPRPNWIWHWAGQMWYMQPCLPGLRMIRFWRVLRAWSDFGPVGPGQGGSGRDRN